MNLVLAYEMGMALLGAGPGSDPRDSWKKALGRLRSSPGLDLQRTVEHVEKGAFPDGLGRLRGHVHLHTNGPTPVGIVVECGPQTVVVISNTKARLHGFWHVESAEFSAFQQDEVHAALPAFLKRVSGAQYKGTWVAYWIKEAPPEPVPVPVTAQVPTPAPAPVEEPVVAAAAPKKKVVRKRVVPPTPVPSTAATEETTETATLKKQAVAAAVAASEEDSGLGVAIN